LAIWLYKHLGPRLFTRRYFEWRYRLSLDPWGYESSPYERRKYERTLEILPAGRRYKRALEVGCSIGVFTRLLAEREITESIVGMDISAQALERARQRLTPFKNVQLKLADLARDPLDGPYDLAFCAEVLFYLGEQKLKIVRDKLTAALESGGHLVLVNPEPAAHWIRDTLLETGKFQLAREHKEPDPKRPYVITLLERTPWLAP
jgi:trans-aconitate methyltransferase